MKRTLVFLACVLASITMQAQVDSNDYIPFVELGKQWHVVSTDANPNYVHRPEKYWMFEKVERDGKTYVHTYLLDDVLTIWQDAGLFREENRRVYKYDENAGKEIMLYDFSLKEGDTFTCDVYKCKVLKQGLLADGPKILSRTNSASADTLETKYRRLRTWTIGLDNGTGEYHEVTTWVEGVGALENTFSPLDRDGRKSCLAYVERKDNRTDYLGNQYLPFSFYNISDVFGQIHGCNLPIGASYHSEDWHHQLTYELEGDRLHVYGKAYTQCGLNNYAYFYEKPTDDPSIHKVEFEIQEVEPIATCAFLHAIDFYVSGFDPNLNYVVVDNQGMEHPVINKTPQTAYRPFVEDGKVWIVRVYSDNLSHDQWTEYLYIDGDTIINGQSAKRMLCDRVDSEYDTIGEYVGAWYEQDKKVYFGLNKFDLLYDFTLSSGDSICLSDYTKYVVNKSYGGISGFKGAYYEFLYNGDVMDRWFEGVGSESWPYINNWWGHVGHTGALLACFVGDEIVYYNSKIGDLYILGARKQRIDFTHTIKIKPKARTMREAEPSLYGEYSEQQLGINLNPLDDAYVVRITDEADKTVYEKTVNAGSIVGLNIDISSYAKGRYTVTVENSMESFTGEIDTRTTGIEDNVRIEKLKNGSIYNLQGQRISSLRKGLNIVSGRKVFVK